MDTHRSEDDIRTSLMEWFHENNGYVNPSLELASNQSSGQHFRASKDLTGSETSAHLLCKCPFSLSLSFLNITTSPPMAIRNCSGDSVCAHLTGKVTKAVQSYFFLCEQKIKGDESFWEPYITVLPEAGKMSTPLWFEQEDLMWLLGTTIHISPEPEKSGVEMRRGMWREQWEQGVEVLKSEGVDVQDFTWELFLWTATIFSSRSFTSSIFTSEKSEAPSSESFALLYPVLDSFNHKFGTKVLWNMDHGDFELSTTESVGVGDEVFNNYAPKGNEELLMGYGFCIPDNPCDQVAIRIGRPPGPVHATLKDQFPARFSSPDWSQDVATFYLRGSTHYSGGYPHQAFLRGIPLEMFGTIQAILAYSFNEQGEKLSDEHLMGATVDAILERLLAKRHGIRQWDDTLPKEPRNLKQRFAKIYRDGQLAILEEIIGELEEFLDDFGEEETS